MSARDILAALSVAIVWGLTFIATKVGVGETSPLMLAALRFLFAAIPMVVFIAPPKAPAWAVALYGLLIGAGQFGLLFIAIHDGFPVGLASLVLQAQLFFTILLARVLLGERPRPAQIVGAAVGFAGMAVIASGRLAGASLGPFLLVIFFSKRGSSPESVIPAFKRRLRLPINCSDLCDRPIKFQQTFEVSPT